MEDTIGTCSLCGGDVIGGGFVMNKCLACGAVEDTGLPVMPMRKSTSDEDVAEESPVAMLEDWREDEDTQPVERREAHTTG